MMSSYPRSFSPQARALPMSPAPPTVGAKVREKPNMNQRREPMTMPVSVCISMLRLFLRRMSPAWVMPMAGVCSMTKDVAAIMRAVSPAETVHVLVMLDGWGSGRVAICAGTHSTHSILALDLPHSR